jgi:hypothetical protein
MAPLMPFPAAVEAFSAPFASSMIRVVQRQADNAAGEGANASGRESCFASGFEHAALCADRGLEFCRGVAWREVWQVGENEARTVSHSPYRVLSAYRRAKK